MHLDRIIGSFLLTAFLWVGCKSEEAKPGRWVSCTCPYLTDFDGVASHSLKVCVPEGADVGRAAHGCATQLTHGPAEPCTCDPPGDLCEELKACKSKEYK